MKGTTKSLGKKNNQDKFYTKEEVAKKCIDKLEIKKYDLIIEPSAGSGSFSNQIENCLAFDIEPENENIIKKDWFTVKKEDFLNYHNILIIGNPPFGQQSNLAIKFFNHAAEIANTIAFILPLSFKKVSITNKLSLNFSLQFEEILREDSFTLENNSYSVPTVFQIWEKTKEPRKKIKLPLTTDLFDFTAKEKADIRIPRVGGNAGKATLSLEGAISSNYFIKNKTKLSNEKFVDLINTIIFPSIEFTVGPKSLPKGELIFEIEQKIKK
jgi:hypothetical protein